MTNGTASPLFNPALDEILRGASKYQLRTIQFYIDQLLDEMKVEEALHRNGLEKGSDQILAQQIEDVDVSVRVFNILRAYKLNDLRAIQELGKTRLRQIRGLGLLGIGELEKVFRQRGLTLE